MVDSSPLSDVLTTDGAARITHNLIAARIISSDARYMTPMQIGGLWSPHTVFAAADYDREAARALCAPIAALTLKADRDAAIAKLDGGLHAAAHSLVGSMWRCRRQHVAPLEPTLVVPLMSVGGQIKVRCRSECPLLGRVPGLTAAVSGLCFAFQRTPPEKGTDPFGCTCASRSHVCFQQPVCQHQLRLLTT